MDLFEKITKANSQLGQYASVGFGYFMFPKLSGQISDKMSFRGKERLVWSLNNYLGLANHPEVRKADAEAAEAWGLGYPMGARMMSGHTNYHEQLERQLADFEKKEDAYLLNYGYQGMVSIIDSLVDRKDVIVYDAEAHACIIDGLRMHIGKRFVYAHNDMTSCEKQLERATKIVNETGGAILVITEGVYGMSGDLGKLSEIIKLKKKYNFRFLVDDAHGFGSMGPTGAGTSEFQGVMDGVDLYFATFAKSMASIGGFVSGPKAIIDHLRFGLRSQIYAKSMPMPLVFGNMKRLELIRTQPQLREKLWTIVNALQGGLKANGFNIGNTNSPVTPVYLPSDLIEGTNITVDLRENYNIFCSIVIYPVIPKGTVILRLIPTAVHTLDDVEYTINAFKEVKIKLESGAYKTDKIPDITEK